jgi:plasmid stabilization system protein ParE
MVAETPRVNLVLAPAAINDLAEIWRWNAERYSPAHADAYLSHLKASINELGTSYGRHRPAHHAICGRSIDDPN